MHYDQLKTFLKVVELKNFTKVAEALHITQSTVTARIQQIEAFYGQKLFIRHKGNIQLTSIGYKLLPMLQRQMNLWEKTKKVANEELENAFQINISATYSLWRKISTNIIKKLYQEHDPSYLHLKTDHSHFIIQNILDGSTDFGIVYNKPISKEIASVLIQKDTFSLYKHRDLRINQPLSFQDLSNETWIYLNWGHSFEAWMEKENEQKIQPKIEVGHSDLAIQLINDVKGLAFLSDNEVKQSDLGQHLERLCFESQSPIPFQAIYFIFKASRKHETPIKETLCLFKNGDLE
ncbi:LysR family transcriptional regulator [Gracilibacillus caseinilyticus]|uniref:LysR family transcriptional regulator n=1 Tax=Gracilibacillus caseinilyticus TaxID=2932256 RepID=A0ABY4EY46_9BACI|nr:LysR family transcriptional regulator [Gracilibacillus caseinilyticus]UOQ49326.1 LysR family transcriptional regulator [Gracilibacillus caseinilyticus]